MSSPTSPSAGPDGAPLAGRLLAGRYRLEQPIASGGMAQVWDALDQTLARRVAVKILHPHLAQDESFVRRFRAEAVAAARLSHPSIVSVYDTCSVDGIEAIVMELVHGTTMRADLDEHGPMKLPAVLAIGTQVADALGAAHAAGLVHRDVKPANILLSADGRVLVADFGIAKAAEGSDLTSAGAMVGTAKYLAPEQVEDGPIDGRADLYALGIVLYEALSGQAPFVAETDAATALARLHRDARPLQELRPEVPDAVAAVVRQAMARLPAERFASAAAMRTALLSAGAEPQRAPQAAAAAAAASGIPSPADPPSTAPLAAAGVSGRPAPPPTAPPPRPVPPAPPVRLATVDEPPVDAPPPPKRGRRRRRAGWALALVGVVVLAVAASGAFGGGGGGDADPDRASAQPLANAQILDPPPGDGAEHDEEAPFAIDGDPSTAWTSESYRDPVAVGGKDGVGLVVSLEDAASIEGIDVATREAGWSVRAYVTNGSIPDALEGWGSPVASVAEVTDLTASLRFDPTEGSHVLLWFTRMPPTGAVAVTGVTVLGR